MDVGLKSLRFLLLWDGSEVYVIIRFILFGLFHRNMNSKSIKPIFIELFPDKNFDYNARLKYSAKFSDYNANIKLSKARGNLVISLSRKWKGVNNEITKGLIQMLLIKMFVKNEKAKMMNTMDTMNIDLYNNFIRSLHLSVPKDNIEPELKRSFDRINDKFFYGQIEIPNLVWGEFSKRKFADYNYHTDTVTFSKILRNQNVELIDYIMYHELLHKKLKFKSSNNRNLFHSTEFRKAEKAYPNSKELEKLLSKLSSNSRKKRLLFGLFR